LGGGQSVEKNPQKRCWVGMTMEVRRSDAITKRRQANLNDEKFETLFEYAIPPDGWSVSKQVAVHALAHSHS
jgi:hypothetical protein